MEVNFKFNDIVSLKFDLTKYKKDILKITKKYILGEISKESDESGTGGFWDLADKIITSNISYVWNYSWSCELQDFLYMKLKEYARIIIKELI